MNAPESTLAANPLLDFSGLPRFAAVTPAHVRPAIDHLINECRATIDAIGNSTETPTWENFVTPLDDVTERLARAWNVASHLNAVVNSPELRDAYNGTLPTVTQFWTELAQDARLFAKYKALRSDGAWANLDQTKKQSLDNTLRDFRLGGAELPADKRARFAAVEEEMSTLSAAFNDNVLDATNAYACFIDDKSELAGLPADVIATARAAAENEGKPGWKLTLHAPCYLRVMQYAESHALRERLYRAYSTRASELGANQKWNNRGIIDRILALRTESAALLGYENFAGVSLATKMAETPADVIAFLREMVAKSKPFARQDWAELTDFAHAEMGLSGLAELDAWDVPYASEKLRQQRYAFSDQEVKQYFPEPKVLEGLFRVIETLYGLHVTPARAETWHADARFFELRDGNGALVGQFYLDLYARESKRGGAWMDDAINRRRKNGALQLPVAYLTCNFAAPLDGKPALFTHDEVITLFHEFGHGLHQLLTDVEELGVSGINGVEWDAVELPSQFMENFCWEWEVLEHMTAHVDTGSPLPRELFDKMIAAKNFQAGMAFVRQLEFGLFDMRLHAEFDAAKTDLLALVDDVRDEVAVVKYPPFNRSPLAFGHIFGGGYAAGYYSYMWALVLAADAYAAFEETGVLNADTGAKFRREVLGRGGSRPALDSFAAFRGRKPEIDALLRHNGMKVAA